MKKLITYLLFLFVCSSVFGQSGSPFAFRYQAVARDTSPAVIPLASMDVKTGIYSGSPGGTLVWEETHSVVTDAHGLFLVTIGTGTTTGNGSLPSFSAIPWETGTYFLKVEENLSGSYVSLGIHQFYAVPYTFFSNKTAGLTSLSVDDLADADTAGVHTDYLLKWNGTNWMPAIDNHSDTVQYAANAAFANAADTTYYGTHIIYPNDTANFAYQTDSSAYSIHTDSTAFSDTSVYSGTATYALYTIPVNWSVTGNYSVPGYYLGTNIPVSMVFKTNAAEKMRIDTTGRIGVGTTSPLATTHFIGNDGFLATGVNNFGAILDSAAGTRLMWYPRKSAFRAGQVDSNYWSTTNIGQYSIATGYNSMAAGLYSGAMGYNCKSLQDNCFSFGKNSYASVTNTALMLGGGCIAMGDSCYVTETRSIAMGYKSRASGGIAIGYKNKVAAASQTSAWGSNTTCNGDCSIAFGTRINSTGQGSFTFADASSSSNLVTSAQYKFIARADSGFVFYTDANATLGVQLFPGGGSWSALSDKKKKENFKDENAEEILKKICQLKITEWNYKTGDKNIRHIGPMAQDFYKAFHLAENKKYICSSDMDGINMIGIKALAIRAAVLTEKLNAVDELKAEAKSLDNFNDLEERLNKIEQTIQNNK